MTKKKTTRRRAPAKQTTRRKAVGKKAPPQKVESTILDLEAQEKKREEVARAEREREAQKPFRELQIADGKSEIEKLKDLEDLLGVKQVNPFGTTSMTILEERMGDMGLSDLQAFAVKIGILPTGNKMTLKTKIKRQFKSHPGAGAAYHIGFQKPLVDPNSEHATTILKILNQNM